MDDLKFPTGNIPQDPPKGLPMDEYLEFVLFCRKNFPPKGKPDMPAPVRFVIRDDDTPFGDSKRQQAS